VNVFRLAGLHPYVAFFGAECNVIFGQTFIVTSARARSNRPINDSNSQAVDAKEI
jgi:hypothetical protein